jgi:hypothetical protein
MIVEEVETLGRRVEGAECMMEARCEQLQHEYANVHATQRHAPAPDYASLMPKCSE